MQWRSFQAKIVVGVVVIVLLTNTLYLMTILNTDTLHDQVNISAAKIHLITTLPRQTNDLKVFDNIIYGIYRDVARTYVLFGYHNHFIFQTKLLNVTFHFIPTINYVIASGFLLILDIRSYFLILEASK